MQENSYYIMKKMTDKKGKVTRVLLVDTHSEIMSFTSRSDAEDMAKIMQTNSDSGWKYHVVAANEK